MKHQETAVTIEKDIEELNCLDKFAKYISLCTYYHLNRCENDIDCSNCTFILNLGYLYAENLISGNIENLQKYCRFHYCNLFSLRTMLRSLAAEERKKLMLEKKILKITKTMELEEHKPTISSQKKKILRLKL